MRRNSLRAVATGAVLLAAVGLWQNRLSIGEGEQQGLLVTSAHAETANPGRKIKFYRNPMGLPDTSSIPKKDSMGMDYIPVYDGDDADDSAVKVSPGRVQRTGVETASASKHSLVRTIKAPGVVQFDETRIAAVSPRFDGYVVAVAPVTTGKHVKKGEELANVFGQEILNQAARLLVEQSSGWRGDESFAPPGQNDRPGGIVGAARRLKNFGVPDDFIEKVKRDRRVPDTFSLRAPIDGVILERNVVDGQGFKAGDLVFRIADHSAVWMLADVAEGDLEALKTGQKVKVSVRAHPGRSFSGEVSLVFPHLMKDTRTVRVRIEMPNPDLALLPDMYGDVEIATGAADEGLTVPLSAVIDSGSRQVVFVDHGEGRYEPRDVKLGRKGDGVVEVLGGIAEGDKVVVNGNFLIDSESNLESALKGFKAPPASEGK